jgi:chromosome segregation ATPase
MDRRFVLHVIVLGVIVLIGALATGCASTRIAVAETFGYAKREQLVDRVQDARDGQEEAKEQFASALEQFLAVTEVEPGALEAQYDKLKREFDRSEAKAESVRDRIRSVEHVAEALFKEWQSELDDYSSEQLRAASAERLESTHEQYDRLLGKMKAAEQSMTPVLEAFSDQVLFLKHNLNARAIASLEDNVVELQSDVGRLIEEMEASIAEANAFIEQMQVDE